MLVLCLHRLILARFPFRALLVDLCFVGSFFALAQVVRTCGLVKNVFVIVIVVVGIVIVAYCDRMWVFSALGVENDFWIGVTGCGRFRMVMPFFAA